MPIPTTCPSCQTVYPLADHLRGKKVRCKNCGETIQVGPSPKPRNSEEAEEEGSSPHYRIQGEARQASRTPSRADDERPRRRPRDDWDEPEFKSNQGLIIGLAVGCGVLLLLLLVGGGIFVFILFGSDSASNTPNSVVVNSGVPPQQPVLPGAVDEADLAGPVIVRVSGVNSEIMGDAIQEKLRQLVDPGPNVLVHGHAVNGQMTVHVMPVGDPQAFADKINFGKVQSVQGRIITMIAGKIEGIPGPDADGVTKALFQLKSPDLFKRHEAVRQLKGALPDERRSEVSKALEPLVTDPDFFTRQGAIEALGIWGTRESVPVLLKAMNDQMTRDAAMEALGRLKDQRAVEPIANRLEVLFDQHQASEALKRMGSMAEEAVLKRLNHPDVLVVLAACDVLQTIGTRRSLPGLQKVIAGGNIVLKRKAEEAIQAINTRQ